MGPKHEHHHKVHSDKGVEQENRHGHVQQSPKQVTKRHSKHKHHHHHSHHHAKQQATKQSSAAAAANQQQAATAKPLLPRVFGLSGVNTPSPSSSSSTTTTVAATAAGAVASRRASLAGPPMQAWGVDKSFHGGSDGGALGFGFGTNQQPQPQQAPRKFSRSSNHTTTTAVARSLLPASFR